MHISSQAVDKEFIQLTKIISRYPSAPSYAKKSGIDLKKVAWSPLQHSSVFSKFDSEGENH